MPGILAGILESGWSADASPFLKKYRMCDIQVSTDIINEVKEYLPENTEFLFRQDNNNGQLFIDVSDSGIKYGFMKYFNSDTVMDAEKYMEWDRSDSGLPNWHVPDKNVGTTEIIYTEKNIDEINEMASLMSLDEIHQFVDWSLEYIHVETVVRLQRKHT